MGSCQSTQAAGSGNTTKPNTAKQVPTSHVASEGAVKRKATSPQSNDQAFTDPTTDLADVSHHSTGSAMSLSSAKSHGSNNNNNNRGKFSSSASGGSTTPEISSGDISGGDDSSSVGSGGGGLRKNPKSLGHSSSIIGLDSMIENRREEGGLRSNVVHMEVPFGKPIEEVYDGVHSGPVLGSGISGLVRLVTHKATAVKYAVKCLDLGLVDTQEGLQQLREEIFIMCQLDHPNIVRLEEVYESHSEIYLVQELCLGGELFDRLDEQPDYHYTEAECARLIKQMLCAVRYLHSKGIIHRDLKLENFLFSSTAKDSELKMIDFGLSKHFRYGEIQHEAVGTPYTVAPEVIRGSYDERCDIWAIGVISFLLLSGDPPFGGCGGPEPLLTVRASILKGAFEFEPEEIWSLVSNRAKEFITFLLVVDPQKRPTAREGQKHAWLREWASRTRTEDDNILNPNVVKALVNFKEFSDMRKLLCEVLSFTLLPDQIKDLRKEFEKMDTDGSGEISLAALKQVLVTNAGAGSLGALTEEEVEDIFNAMRVKKTETRIHWHEFIAAGLSQCQVDDRNLRLAFERLDSDHKGYVTLDDIMDLVGNDSFHSEEVMRKMWGDSMKAVNCNQTRITYGDFLLLMKGQTKGTPEGHDSKSKLITTQVLLVVPEEQAVLDDETQPVNVEKTSVENAVTLPSGDVVTADGQILQPRLVLTGSDHGSGLKPLPSPLSAIPLTPIASDDNDDMDMQDTPLSMDDDDDLAASPMSMDFRTSSSRSLIPPMSPQRGDEDNLSPVRERRMSNEMFDKKAPQLQLPGLGGISKPALYSRQRSRSMGDEDDRSGAVDNKGENNIPKFAPDARRALALPEREKSQAYDAINDKSKSALQVNRQLYRAHRHMRISVVEASKRFEEQQARRARDFLIAQNEAEGDGLIKAGLVMRRGQNKQVSSEAIKIHLEQSQTQQEALVVLANKRGGRGRRTRKKTISDMSGMIGSLSQEELAPICIAAAVEEELIQLIPNQPAPLKALLEDSLVIPEVVLEPTEANVRGATVLGEFRKVKDPFSAHGKYGLQLS